MNRKLILVLLLAAPLAFSDRPAYPGGTMTIQELRQKLEIAKLNYKGNDRAAFEKAIDQSLTSLQARYGENISAVEAVKVLREFARDQTSAPTTPAATSATTSPTKPPDSVHIEFTPIGFELRAPCRSFGGLALIFVAAVVFAIPFVVMGDFVRQIWDAEGLSLWLGIAFLTAWFGAGLYTLARGAVAICGEIRISKSGDNGAIFTGIGPLGLTHRIQWSDYSGAADRAVAVQTSRGLFTHTIHYIGLNGPSKRYKFGSDLTAEQQAFVIAFLKQHVFQASK